MIENIIWYITMIPCSSIFTGIGIYAWKRKNPMWFWSGTVILAEEIRDVTAYNRANGYMWIGFSCLLWLSTFTNMISTGLAAVILGCSFVLGFPVLFLIYRKIYNYYKQE